MKRASLDVKAATSEVNDYFRSVSVNYDVIFVTQCDGNYIQCFATQSSPDANSRTRGNSRDGYSLGLGDSRGGSRGGSRSDSRPRSRLDISEGSGSLDSLRTSSPKLKLRPMVVDPLQEQKLIEARMQQYRVERTPNARLGHEVPIADKTKVLGSSQVLGCQGDFCNFDMGYLEDGVFTEFTGQLKTAKSLNDFRSRLLAQGTSTDFIAKDSAVSKLLQTEKGFGGKNKSLPQLKPLTGSSATQSTAGASPADTTNSAAVKKITLKSIIQARQEMPLVKMQLERHRKGDPAPYVREETYTDMAVAGKLPGHYYKEVPCCLNCFKVYNIVDTARSKALSGIAKKKVKPVEVIEKDHERDNVEFFTVTTGDTAAVVVSGLTNHQVRALQNLGSGGRKRNYGTGTETGTGTGTVTATLSTMDQQSTEEAELVAEEERRGRETLQAALQAIDGLTKMDVAEIRTMTKPHAAVEVVMEAVIVVLTGRVMTFKEAHGLLSNGEFFLKMLKEFDIADVTDERLKLVEPYVDNPLFRPENVLPVSFCASKFCAWVHGIAHAARYQRGLTHKRIDIIRAAPSNSVDAPKRDLSYLKPLRRPVAQVPFNRGEYPGSMGAGRIDGYGEETSFVQKVEKIKATRGKNVNPISRHGGDVTGSASHTNEVLLEKSKPTLRAISRSLDLDNKMSHSLQQGSVLTTDSTLMTRSINRLDPGPTPMSMSGGGSLFGSTTGGSNVQQDPSMRKPTKREFKAIQAVQKKATDRLSALNASEGANNILSAPKEFRCSDGITKMPYMVLGQVSLNINRCSFIVIHDFFDTCDASAIMFKPIVQRHEGCQVFCFNYPGQAHTVWPRPSATEKERGAKEPILNNDWIADRLNELLRFAEDNGDLLLTNPFHLVGIGNGACIATAFCQRWGRDKAYVKGLRSVVSINGFLYPDPQLTSILHSAYQVFESAPHSRPDIPVSFWSRFVFSEEYLLKINPNLALNIYTAVSNPITNEGRSKIAQGCLKHRDMRGCLSPDYKPARSNSDNPFPSLPVQVPIIVLQSTENSLVNGSNVDAFLQGRNCKHLWSHALNVPTEALQSHSLDMGGHWVGKLSSGPEDYHKFSTLGRSGLKMLLESLRSPRGAFCMWTRNGHVVHQEYKAAVLDLLDVLACPTDEYVGIDAIEAQEAQRRALLSMTNSSGYDDEKIIIPEPKPAKVEVLFQLNNAKDEEVSKKEPEEVVDEENMDISQILDAAIERPVAVIEEDVESEISIDNSSMQELMKDIGYTKPQLDIAKPVENDEDLELQIDADVVTSESGDRKECENEPTSPFTPDASMSLASLVKMPEVASAHSSHALEQSPIMQPMLRAVDQEEGEEARRSMVSLLPAPGALMSPPKPTHNPAPKPSVANPVIAIKSLSPVVLNDLYAMERPDLPEFDTGLIVESSYSSPARIADYVPPSVDIDATDRTGAKLIRSIKDGVEKNYIANDKQKVVKEWTTMVPDAATALELEAELRQKQQEFLELENRLKEMRALENSSRITRIEEAQASRREEYGSQDKQLLAKLQADLDTRQRERDFAEKQRRVELAAIEKALVKQGMVPAYTPNESASSSEPVVEIAPMRYEHPADLPRILQEGMDVVSKLDRMKEDEVAARKHGTLSVEEYEKVKREMMVRQMQRDDTLRHLSQEEKDSLYEACAVKIQMIGRGYLGRRKALATLEKRKQALIRVKMAIKVQSVMRGFLGKKRFNRIKDLYLNNMKNSYSAGHIQRMYRGHAARKYFRRLRRWICAGKIERVFRGHLGRLAFQREKQRLELLRTKELASAKLQSVWRMKVAKEEFRSLRIHVLASIEIQRTYRGYLGRKQMARKRLWESTAPGPDRIRLGLEFIEESKQAFERQQEEIDALHRAQERAEARVSHIHAELTEAEKELVVLERELQEIDQIERDLNVLTHERDLLNQGIEDAAGMPRLAGKGHKELVMGKESTNDNDPIHERRRKAEAYALEMTIQIKRAEREKKRQELEIEFAAVFQEVEKKKKALERLELSLNDMETTRERKDREFRRLQANLMQLLKEQKQELDDLREKGIELETATATTAAAAVATAQKAREHEQRSTAMFAQTEELMKFQFMSMSLSYFSNLNMLKSLREMNADTTSAAITLSADASATAAASAAAANLPNMKKLNLGANDFVEGHIHRKKAELQVSVLFVLCDNFCCSALFNILQSMQPYCLQLSQESEKEYKRATENPIPDNVRSWTVSDVARWLDTLTLTQYIPAFTEGSVDGPFLMELREEDLVQVLGIKHKLHVRKILLSREKLKPLNQQEMRQKEAVEIEVRRKVDTLFSYFSRVKVGFCVFFSYCRNVPMPPEERWEYPA